MVIRAMVNITLRMVVQFLFLCLICLVRNYVICQLLLDWELHILMVEVV